MKITATMVMDLRKRTGVGMSQCKKALQEGEGNIDKAIHILRKKGIASAVKKGGRATKEGMIGIKENDHTLFLVEVNAETDFVIQNDRFKEFINNICEEAIIANPPSVDAFLNQKYSKNPLITIDQYRAEIVQMLGENIRIKRMKRWEKMGGCSLGVYSHMGGKIVAVVTIKGSCDQQSFSHDIAMHIVAEAPDYLHETDIPTHILAKEEDIARSQITNKPVEIVDKIIKGKLRNYYEQVCLMNQRFVKNPTVTVAEYIVEEGKKMGKTLEITDFIRWEIGD